MARSFILRCSLVMPIIMLCSCNLLTPFAFVAGNSQTIAPEFDKLPSKRTAVLVWTDPSTLFDYPYARFELASYIGNELFSRMNESRLDADIVDPRDVEDYLQKNLSARIDPLSLGRAFDADYVIYLEILRFGMRDMEHPQFLRGHIEASVSVHDIRTQYDDLRQFELTPITCTYPEGAPVIMTATNPPLIRESTYRKFAEQVARKFYEHTIYE